MKQRIYEIRHRDTGLKLKIKAGSFRDAVSKTFDSSLSAWSCESGGALNDILAKMRQFAHDASGPLSFIREYIAVGPDRCAEILPDEDIGAIAQRAYSKIEDILLKIRNCIVFDQDEVPVRCDFAGIVSEVIQELSPVAERRKVHLNYIGPDSIFAILRRGEISALIYNLVTNAIEAAAEGGGLVEICASSCADEIRFSVSDDGVGISDEIRERIFERGFSSGKKCGSGFGLSSAKETARKHMGDLWLDCADGERTSFVAAIARDCSSVNMSRIKSRLTSAFEMWPMLREITFDP
ncbi:MAG TPA: HAMP domain-containing sensor histidine kinase [bacterium]|nr:HAMP domain-containing histidine kinase [Myxococcales bacterium]OQA59154.1 MAG: Phytochrome-like protein cph1 [bacterium ADurb.Bin270]HPW46115.1 HAMP domain-containing sensor histidine kinase [bacterium]HQC50757.1 HAMP domain-containing sensor histidine kinase [bacterium]HQG13963.1 HAMP domain-containing sensor histidine kinase [bacterium]